MLYKGTEKSAINSAKIFFLGTSFKCFVTHTMLCKNLELTISRTKYPQYSLLLNSDINYNYKKYIQYLFQFTHF